MGRGRNFYSEEDQPGHEFEAILSWSTWQDYFGGSEDILQKKVVLDGKPYTVVGILPKTFYLISRMQILVPIRYDLNSPGNRRGYHLYRPWGRLRTGVSLEQANAELALVSDSLARQYPDEDGGVGAIGIELQETRVGDVRTALFSLFGAVACVLLMTCGNVAGLLLARSSARQREISVRIAIGASQMRIVRQLLTESVFLSTIAGMAGLGLAAICTRAVTLLPRASVPHSTEVVLDWHVVVFALAVALLTGILFGLTPALQSYARNVNEGLKQSGVRSTETRAQRIFRQVLTLAQAAFATVLLIGSGLLIRSFAELSKVHLGFDPQHVLVLNFSLSTEHYEADGAIASFSDQVLHKVASLPGVQEAAFADNLPLARVRGGGPIAIEGRPAPSSMSRAPDVLRTRVTDSYFRLMRIPLLRGRGFGQTDRQTSTPVVVINETLARRLFRGEDPVGKRLRFVERPGWKQIVGIVGDVPQDKLENPVRPEIFLPIAQEADVWTSLVVRVSGDPSQYLNGVNALVKQVDPQIASFGLRQTLSQQLSDALGWRTFVTSSLTLFSAVAMILAAIGIYAMISYSVAQRNAEIGIRKALGAQEADILRMIVRQGLTPALAGGVAGLLISLAASRALVSLLFEVRTGDGLTYALVPLILTGVAFLASYIPARRAASVDPSVSLRNE